MTKQPDIVSVKQKLREKMMAVRSGLSPGERQKGAKSLSETGLGFLASKAGSAVSAFAAIGEEINPLPLLKHLHANGHQLGLPVVVARDQPLVFRQWKPGDPLVKAGFGLRVPDASAEEILPDILLVPLLAFDARGYRLGYGGGYFDRTLAMLRASRPVLAVGLAFDIQEVDEVPHADYDERLDWVLTPSGPKRIES